jgi:hypothetical protein
VIVDICCAPCAIFGISEDWPVESFTDCLQLSG